jgi:hypothetical protein
MLRSERNRFDLLDDVSSRAQLLAPVRTPGTPCAKRRAGFLELSWPCRYAGTLECPPISTHGRAGPGGHGVVRPTHIDSQCEDS